MHATKRGETLRDHARAGNRRGNRGKVSGKSLRKVGLLMTGSNVLARRVRSMRTLAIPVTQKLGCCTRIFHTIRYHPAFTSA